MRSQLGEIRGQKDCLSSNLITELCELVPSLTAYHTRGLKENAYFPQRTLLLIYFFVHVHWRLNFGCH